MRKLVLGTLIALLLTGCASGPHYWTRPGANESAFLADRRPCFDAAYIAYGAGSEAAYKGCMRSKGWMRVQGNGSQYPTVPHFRGPEGDDEFKPGDQTWFRSQGRAVDTGAINPLCERAPTNRPPGTVCP